MRRDTLNRYFRADLAVLMGEYSRALADMLSTNDVVVFVARRAYTLYEALLAHGCIDPVEKCQVISSRALSFSMWSFDTKRVAIADDVMIRGEALKAACDYVWGSTPHCTGLVAASCSPSSEEHARSRGVKLLVLRHLEKSDVYELTREINDFVQAAGLTNNIDQPVFTVDLPERATLRDVLESHDWFNCTTRLQRASGILSATITYDACELPFMLPLTPNETRDVLTKVRIICREESRSATMLPFVVLPELDPNRIDAMYRQLVASGLEENAAMASRRDASADESKNKLRVVQYLLSWRLGNASLASMPEVSGRVARQREVMLFGSTIGNDDLVGSLEACSAREAELSTGEMSRYDQREISKQVRAEYLIHDMSHRGRNGCDPLCFTPLDLRNCVIRTFAKHDWMPSPNDMSSVQVASSVCVDYLIDSGILVPRLKKAPGCLVRSYGSGEIERLSMLEIELFEYAVCTCLDRLGWRSIRCSTLNRIAVLFSREMKKKISFVDNDETSVFDFVYTREEELRAAPEAAPFGLELLPQILVGGGRLCWASDDARHAVRTVAGIPDLAEYELSRKKEDHVRAAASHLVDYLSTAGEDGADGLLRTLIMYGSKRYVLGTVTRRLGAARYALDNAVYPTKPKKLRGGFDDAFDFEAVRRLNEASSALVRTCEWALGNEDDPTSAGAKTLTQEYFEAATLIEAKTHCLRGDLTERVEEDSFGSASDVELLNEYIRDARVYGEKLLELLANRDKQQISYARRLAAHGEMLRVRSDALLGSAVAKAGQLLVEDRRIGAVVCSMMAEAGERVRFDISFHTLIHGVVADLDLGSVLRGSLSSGSGLLIVLFAPNDCCPHEILMTGDRSSLSDLSRLRRLYSERMREAVAALCDGYASLGSRTIAFCHPLEDPELRMGDSYDMLPRTKDGEIDLRERIDSDARTEKLFERCGTKVEIYHFGER